MSTCVNCSQPFKKKAGDTGYYRFSIENVLPSTGEPARLQLQTILGQPVTPVTKKLHGQFLCPQCWNKTNAAGKYYKACKEFLTQTSEQSYLSTKRSRSESLSPGSSFKRPRFTSTPLQHKSKAARNIFGSAYGSVSSKWDTIITAIKARQYRRAIQNMYNATSATKRHFVYVAVGIVRKEIKSISKEKNPLAKNVDIPNIQEFSWENTLDMAERSAPLLLGVLKGAMTTKRNENSLVRGNHVELKPKIGTALAFLLHARYPQIFRFLPILISVQFWRGD